MFFTLDTEIVQNPHHTLLGIECNLKPSVSFCSSNSNSVFFYEYLLLKQLKVNLHQGKLPYNFTSSQGYSG